MKTIYLERWLHDKILKKRENSPNYQKRKSRSTSGKLTRAEVEAYQLIELKKILEYAYEKSTYYRQVFKKHNINPMEIRALSDLARIPLTDQTDLAENPNRFLCVSHSGIKKVTTFTTSGTTGPQKRVFCTQDDVERITDFMGAGLRTVAGTEDIVQIILPSGTSNNQGGLLSQGLKKQGIRNIKAGLNLSAQEQLEIIRQHRPTVLFGVTSRVYRMTQELKQHCKLDKLGIKTVFVTSGYLSESMRDQLSEIWEADVHNHYGMTEMGLGVAVECHAHDGYHFNEADLILEVVNPETGEVLDEGEGELVVTTLTREGMPLIRYKTNDLSHWINEPCPCGATSLKRLGKISRRLGSSVEVGDGDEIYFSLFDDALYRIPELVDYQIEATKNGAKSQLYFTAEVTIVSDDVRMALRKAVLDSTIICKNLANGSMVEPIINLSVIGTFGPQGRAKKMIISSQKREHRNGSIT